MKTRTTLICALLFWIGRKHYNVEAYILKHRYFAIHPAKPCQRSISFKSSESNHHDNHGVKIAEEVEIERNEQQLLLKSKLKERTDLQRNADISVPVEKQCLRYRWFQTESMMSVEIPMYKMCRESEINLVMSETGVHISINNDPDFEPIVGAFAGRVDTVQSRYSLHSDMSGNYLAMILRKQPNEGTSEFWYNLIEGEIAAPTIRYRGRSQHFSWIQGPNTIDINFPLPKATVKKCISLDLRNDGNDLYSLSLSVSNYPPLVSFQKQFRGPIAMVDCFWMLDETESGDKVLNLHIAKRMVAQDQKSSWWAGLFNGDNTWGE